MSDSEGNGSIARPVNNGQALLRRLSLLRQALSLARRWVREVDRSGGPGWFVAVVAKVPFA